MNSLLSRALELQRMAHELMYLDTNGSPIYSDEFCRLNKEVLTRSDSLFSEQSSDIEEEGNLCLALLMGYNATIYDNGDKERKTGYFGSYLQYYESTSGIFIKNAFTDMGI